MDEGKENERQLDEREVVKMEYDERERMKEK